MPIYEEPNIVEYPFHGVFYKPTSNGDVRFSQQTVKRTAIYETDCDIQKNAGLHNQTLYGAKYTVYFPLELNEKATGTSDKFKDCGVRRGHIFVGSFYGNEIEGNVEVVRPSQLGAMSVDIKVSTGE